MTLREPLRAALARLLDWFDERHDARRIDEAIRERGNRPVTSYRTADEYEVQRDERLDRIVEGK